MSVESMERPGLETQRNQAERAAAIRRIQNKRELMTHAVSFVVINAVVVVIWLTTGGGYFWPGWLIGLWAAGLILHAWDVLRRRPITEAQIDAELQRMQR